MLAVEQKLWHRRRCDMHAISSEMKFGIVLLPCWSFLHILAVRLQLLNLSIYCYLVMIGLLYKA